MMTQRTRLGIAAVGVLAALSFWLNRDPGHDQPSAIAGLDTRLNYALQDFEAQYFDEQGRLAGKLTAPRLANDAETGIGTIERPRFEVMHEGRHWTILSETATVTSDHEFVLFSGRVDMLGKDPELDREVKVRTSEVTLEIEPRMVRSDAEITMLEGTSALNAHGFRLDMTSNQFHLASRVEAHYVVQ